MSYPEQLYTSARYLELNPSWDREDAPWKAARVMDILRLAGSEPVSICEVGCGSGDVLAQLRLHFPDSRMSGFDISPYAKAFWHAHETSNISFHVGDFLSGDDCFDTILLLDVLEHLADPHGFLSAIRARATQFVIHFPLDLSVSSVLRESPLLNVRRKVGHIHYFTRGLALELLDECGFEVVHSQFTGAAFNAPRSSWKTRIAQIPRRIAYALNQELGVRLLGGETLIVLAKPK